MNKVNNIQGLSYVNPEGIVPFENNPFEVRDDEEMKRLIESIKEYGRVLHTDVQTRLHWDKKGDRMEKNAWRLQLYW